MILKIYLNEPANQNHIRELFGLHKGSGLLYTGAASMGINGYAFQGDPVAVNNFRKRILHLAHLGVPVKPKYLSIHLQFASSDDQIKAVNIVDDIVGWILNPCLVLTLTGPAYKLKKAKAAIKKRELNFTITENLPVPNKP